jgi:hypothetical protein
VSGVDDHRIILSNCLRACRNSALLSVLDPILDSCRNPPPCSERDKKAQIIQSTPPTLSLRLLIVDCVAVERMTMSNRPARPTLVLLQPLLSQTAVADASCCDGEPER